MADENKARDRARSLGRKDLLENQLASIVKTLTNASQRRNSAFEKKMRERQMNLRQESLHQPVLADNKVPPEHRKEERRELVTAISELEAVFGTSGHSLENNPVPRDKSTTEDDACQKMLDELDQCTNHRESGALQHIPCEPVSQHSLRALMRPVVGNHVGQPSEAAEMLTELEQRSSSTRGITANINDNDALKEVVTEATEGASKHDIYSLTMRTDLDKHIALHNHKTDTFTVAPHDTVNDNDNDEDLEALATRLLGLRALLLDPAQDSINVNTKDNDLRADPSIVPFVVALRLESHVKEWHHAIGWTLSVFSSKMKEQAEQREKMKVLSRAQKQLDDVIQQTLLGEKQHAGFESQKAKLARRIIVSNLAAGASAEDLRFCFRDFKFDIQSVTVLAVRNPKTGTRTAYIDMMTRQAAIRASCQTYAVFGLFLGTQLATTSEV